MSTQLLPTQVKPTSPLAVAETPLVRVPARSAALRLGLIGCGAIAAGSHLPAIAATPSLALAAVLDPDPEPPALARHGRSLPGGVLRRDPERFYAAGLDAVVVTSPAPTHREIVLEAVSRGLPVLCEKPLAGDPAEAPEMVDAAIRRGVPLHVGYCYRFSPVAATIRRLVRDGAVGEPRTLRLIYNWACHGAAIEPESVNPPRFHSHVRRDGRMREGGPMVDCGTHQIDLARWWLGQEVRRVTGHGSWADDTADYEAPDHVWAHLDHAGGTHTAVEMSFSYGHKARNLPKEFVYEVIGTEGVIRYDRMRRRFDLIDGRGNTPLEFGREKGFGEMYHAWAEMLRGGVADDRLCTGSDAARVSELAWEATRQAIASRHGPPVGHAEGRRDA
ncbi:MAG: Gfo/Idh/MocA family oxidoreductase [Planctomycetota bacterium]